VSNQRFSISLLVDWLIDGFLSATAGYSAKTKLPPLESTDGLEPTDESRREEARRIDALKQPDPPQKPSLQKSKSLDQEFWNTF